MNHTRHHPTPGRPTPCPTLTPGSNPLPFFHEPIGCTGHDLLVLNARPDLAPGSIGSTGAFLQRCFSEERS